MNTKYIGTKCDNCRWGVYHAPDNGQEWHVVCNDCEAIHICYEPLPHQAEFHADPTKYRMFAGG